MEMESMKFHGIGIMESKIHIMEILNLYITS